MYEVWVKVKPWNKAIAIAALEGGADAVIIPSDKDQDVKELGVIKTVSSLGDLKWEEDVVCVEVQSQGDEDRIVSLSRDKYVVVTTTDWTVIPLENLVARAENIFVEVETLEELTTAMGVLEKGVYGVIINHKDPLKVKELISVAKDEHKTIELTQFQIKEVLPIGMGDRVCVDTCTLMGPGQGILVSNSSSAFFLVHSESIKNPYVAPRPFRVNAGCVHAYVITPGGRTKYLSELEAGSEVMGVDANGRAFALVVGRVKIEMRPLILVRAEAQGHSLSIVLQNAETIRLVSADGEPVSVVNLSPGDKVLGHWIGEARHFGYSINEKVVEK